MGFLEKAYHSFQAAVKLDPELADAQYNLGNIFRVRCCSVPSLLFSPLLLLCYLSISLLSSLFVLDRSLGSWKYFAGYCSISNCTSICSSGETVFSQRWYMLPEFESVNFDRFFFHFLSLIHYIFRPIVPFFFDINYILYF